MEYQFQETAIVVVIALAGSALLGLFFKRWRQPAVIAEIIIGVILGPGLLGLINPEQDKTIQFLASLGLVVLMFEVGIETKLQSLFKVFIPSFLVAIIGVLFPLALGFAVYMIMGGNAVAALFVGATLTATSVGITIRVLMDLKKLETREAQIILGAAVIDDILGLALLSVLGQIAKANQIDFVPLMKVLGIVVLFIGTFLILGVTLANKIFNVVVRFAKNEVFLVAIFSFCLGLAILAAQIGLAAFVGAFMAGLILERAGKSELVEKEFKTLSHLFTPLFFVSAGALFDISLFWRFDLYPIAGALLLVAILGKIVSGLGAIRQNAKKFLIGVGMIPRGEVGLIFASFGLTLGLVGKDIYSALLLVIILTTILGSLFLRFLMREKTIKKS